MARRWLIRVIEVEVALIRVRHLMANSPWRNTREEQRLQQEIDDLLKQAQTVTLAETMIWSSLATA